MAVSIHAPRVGGDDIAVHANHAALVSIHAPRVGGDTPWRTFRDANPMFQSTPPAWGATAHGATNSMH